MSAPRLSARVFDIDCEAEANRIAHDMLQLVAGRLRRRGVVIALSGGVDSSVCCALAVRACGPAKVFGLMLPERDSSPESLQRAKQVADRFGISYAVEDIAPALEALGCYARRDEAMRSVFPDYRADWKSKITIAGGGQAGFNYFNLVVQSPAGERHKARLPAREYLQIVAATNIKPRVRKMLEYFHADRLSYAVIGTPNLLEYDQGFFVKNGDGAADVKPIAHLYKTQVYALARHLGIPAVICEAAPSTDTYSLPQGQDEFYFALPYGDMDLALWARNHDVPAEELAEALAITPGQARLTYRDIDAKRTAAGYLHSPPLLAAPVPQAV